MKKTIYTKNAPEPVGPYSQAVLQGDTLYISGQIALDPESGTMVTESIEAETAQVLDNINNVLEAAGSSPDSVLKTICYLVDINDFARFNAVYERYFSESKPARSTVEVSALPKGARVEIEVIASVNG